MEYLKSLFGYSLEVSKDVKDGFTTNVVPEIEKYYTNVKKRKMIQQLERTPVKQSIEKWRMLKELLSITPKSYVVIEDRKVFNRVPRVSILPEYRKFVISKNKVINNPKILKINQPKSEKL